MISHCVQKYRALHDKSYKDFYRMHIKNNWNATTKKGSLEGGSGVY